MPKQLIYSDQPNYYRHGEREVYMDRRGFPLWDLTGEETEADLAAMPTAEELGPIYQRGIKVGWSKGRFVEIGLAEFEISTELTPGSRGIFATFDRDGLNRLIRALRQARDDAYGKDA